MGASKTPNPMQNFTGVGIALGTAFGAALGAATENTGTGIAIGVALGAALGAAIGSNARKKQHGSVNSEVKVKQ